MAVVQYAGAQEYFRSASDYARLYVGPIEPQYQVSLWHDIPYYKGNTNVYQGRISYHGVVYDQVQLRFDLLEQRVAVLSPVKGVFCLPEQAYIDWFEMDGRRYVHDPEDSTRYAALLCDGSGNGVRLYHSVWKVYRGENTFGEKKYVKVLSTNEYYSLQTADGAIHHVKNAGDVAKIFPEQKGQIKQMAKQRRLSFSKKERGNSLVKVVEGVVNDRERGGAVARGRENTSSAESNLVPPYPRTPVPPILIPEDSLITGIPVLDSDTLSTTGSAKTKVYIVPGVQKARASVADDQELAEIVVVGGRQSAVRSTTMGSEKFKPQLLKNIPSAFGESDIMKVVLTLPGVTTVGEASSGYNVRGGATDQNLILFNGGTVYNPSHLFGLFTSFNSDAVEDVELFKSSIPVEYGGRISSVLKVTSKEANMQKLTGSASIGALTSKANVEVPIVKDHLSLLLNGRTTYSDWMLKQLPEDSGYKNGSANFYDFSGVLTWKLNSLHRLKIYGYWSHDKFSFSSQDKYGYENRNFSAEWRSLLNERVTLTASAGLDHYDYFNEDRNTPSMAARLSFGIDQIWGKLHIRQRLSEKQVLSYGLSVQHYNVQGGTYEPIGEEYTDKIDVFIVPMCAFDKKLMRAGFGKGYYDKFLADKKGLKIGVAFSCQEVEQIFKKSTDVCMDMIITEKEIIK
jgi:hypothetical protein